LYVPIADASFMSRPHSPVWRIASLLIACLCLMPVLVVSNSLLHPDLTVWAHIAEYVLPDLLVNTASLLLGVSALTLCIGVGLAWLVSVCDFPGRRAFAWMLALPMALPAYVAAFADVGMLDFTGTLQTWLRATFDWQGQLPPVRSRAGVICVFSLSLYPYVYLLSRQAFSTQGKRALEAAQSLGYSPWQGFWRIALPAARPWIAGGLLLVWMETLADFGTVSVFNFDTFTTAIYKSWFALFRCRQPHSYRHCWCCWCCCWRVRNPGYAVAGNLPAVAKMPPHITSCTAGGRQPHSAPVA
jgi:iron(III) transport system permease protein